MSREPPHVPVEVEVESLATTRQVVDHRARQATPGDPPETTPPRQVHEHDQFGSRQANRQGRVVVPIVDPSWILDELANGRRPLLVGRTHPTRPPVVRVEMHHRELVPPPQLDRQCGFSSSGTADNHDPICDLSRDFAARLHGRPPSAASVRPFSLKSRGAAIGDCESILLMDHGQVADMESVDSHRESLAFSRRRVWKHWSQTAPYFSARQVSVLCQVTAVFRLGGAMCGQVTFQGGRGRAPPSPETGPPARRKAPTCTLRAQRGPHSRLGGSPRCPCRKPWSRTPPHQAENLRPPGTPPHQAVGLGRPPMSGKP